MTAYGGFCLLAEFLNKIHFKEGIEKIIPVNEISGNRLGVYSKVLSMLLIVFAGGDRFSHMLYLGCSEILGSLFAAPKRLPMAATTLSRMFGKIKNFEMASHLQSELWSYMKSIIHWDKIGEEWLGLDSTVLVRHGKQQGAKRGYNPQKKGRASHHPLLGFLNRSRYIINLWNRPGNTSSNNNVLAFFEECWERLKDLVNLRGVIADSGFYDEAFIKLIESKNLKYVIAGRLYSTLQQAIYAQQNWIEVTKGIWLCEFWFKHNEWETERRYVSVRQSISKRDAALGKQLKLFEMETGDYRYGVWVTNLSDSPYEVWKTIRPRSNDENIIKEAKDDFSLGGFVMKNFYATESAMAIRMLIYNIFVLFRKEILNKKEKPKRLKTLRFKYFVIPAQLGRDGHKNVLRLSIQSRKLKSKINYLLHQVKQYTMPIHTKCNALA